MHRLRKTFIFYADMSSFAVMGSSLRVYLSRFLGSDCSLSSSLYSSRPYYEDTIHHHGLYVCVTSSSNALFFDLPTNILGSFLIGVLSCPQRVKDGPPTPPLPWLQPNHRMQSKDNFHLALRSAFCGSLTTFSSWNTSMVLLITATLNGEETKVGSGIASALLGYFLGLTCFIMSFMIGRDFALSIHRFRTRSPLKTNDLSERCCQSPTTRCLEEAKHRDHEITTTGSNSTKIDLPNPSISDSTEDRNDTKDTLNTSMIHGCNVFCNHTNHVCDQIIHWDFLPLLGAVAIVILYILGHAIYHQSFYKQMWISSLFSILGALLRWKLGELFNKGALFQSRENLKWIPWGTLIANISASIISIVITASLTRAANHSLNYSSYGSIIATSLKVGFAGSLSTVSTFVKEIVELYDPCSSSSRSYCYAFGSLFISCALCLALYYIILV